MILFLNDLLVFHWQLLVSDLVPSRPQLSGGQTLTMDATIKSSYRDSQSDCWLSGSWSTSLSSSSSTAFSTTGSLLTFFTVPISIENWWWRRVLSWINFKNLGTGSVRITAAGKSSGRSLMYSLMIPSHKAMWSPPPPIDEAGNRQQQRRWRFHAPIGWIVYCVEWTSDDGWWVAGHSRWYKFRNILQGDTDGTVVV